MALFCLVFLLFSWCLWPCRTAAQTITSTSSTAVATPGAAGSGGSFISPAPPNSADKSDANGNYNLQDVIPIQWYTEWQQVKLVLWQVGNSTIYTVKSFDGNPGSYMWTVSNYDYNIDRQSGPVLGPVFYFAIFNAQSSGQYFVSHNFNITYNGASFGSLAAARTSLASWPASLRPTFGLPTSSLVSAAAPTGTSGPRLLNQNPSSSLPSSSASSGNSIGEKAPMGVVQPTAAAASATSGGMSGNAKVGLGIGVGLGIPLLVGLIFFCVYVCIVRKRRRDAAAAAAAAAPRARPNIYIPYPTDKIFLGFRNSTKPAMHPVVSTRELDPAARRVYHELP